MRKYKPNYNLEDDIDVAPPVPPRTSGLPVYRVAGALDEKMTMPKPLPNHTRPTQTMPGIAPRPQVRPQAPVPTFSLPQPTNRATTRPQSLGLPSIRWKWVMFAIAFVASALIAYWILSGLFRAWQIWQDDMTYGRPRTMQVDHFVGHNEQDGTPSHFIAQNKGRQVVVIEYPGGDPAKIRVFQGPTLFGRDAELYPVKIRFEDVNGDGHVDMLLSVDNQLIVYVNQDGNFRPVTGEERVKLKALKGTSD